ncbi:MAG: hypothetical protein JNM38_12980 [Acidobacteria bacterium]|nr:hypothetical protein [Acidobacteriota bacterium]
MAAAIVEALARASLQGGALALVAWAVCRLVPALPATARVVLWWLVALKFLVGLAWVQPVVFEVFDAPVVPSVAACAASFDAPTPRVAPAVPTHEPDARELSSVQAVDVPVVVMPPSRARTWQHVVAASWGAGVCVVLGLGLWRLRATSVVVRHADAAPEWLRARAEVLAWRMGMTPPRVCVSDDVASPMVRGLWRQVVIVPRRSLEALGDAELAMVVCHELVHLRRRDLWLGCVPDAATRLFFFHPLAHLVAREYRLAREAACDAEVLQTLGAEPRDYGRLLLALGVVGREPAFAAAGASRSFADMKRRLQMLNHFDPTPRMRRLGRLLLGGAVAAVIPLQLVARPPVVAGAARAADLALAGQPVEALPPEAPRALAAPLGVAEPSNAQDRHGRRDFEWMLMRADGDTSGTHDDRARVRRFQRDGEPLLWVRIDAKEFVIRDAQVVREAEAAFDEVEAIGRRMGEIGGQQGTLGARQAEVGAKQAQVGARQAALGAQIGELAQKQVALAMERVSRAFQRSASRRDDVMTPDEERKLDQQLKELSARIEALSGEIEELAKPLQDFARQMEPFAAQLREMGAQIKVKVAEAEAQVRALAQRAIADGRAEAVK